MITTMTIRYGALDRSLGKFGRVPDPPDINAECEYDDFNEDNCYFCTNFDNCKEEYERETNNGADAI